MFQVWVLFRDLQVNMHLPLILLLQGYISWFVFATYLAAMNAVQQRPAQSPQFSAAGSKEQRKAALKAFLIFWILNPHIFFSPPIPNYKLSSWEAHSPPSLLIVWQKREAAVENTLGLLPDLGLVCATINGRSATLLFLKNLISLGFMAIAQIGLLVL